MILLFLGAVAAWVVAASAWTGSDDFGPLEIAVFAAAAVATVAVVALLVRELADRRAGRA